METIYLIVRNIVFIVLLAVFWKCCYAEGDSAFSGGGCGVVCGYSILNPLVSWLHDEELQQLDLQMGNQDGELERILEQEKSCRRSEVNRFPLLMESSWKNRSVQQHRWCQGVSGASADLVFCRYPGQPAKFRKGPTGDRKDEKHVEPVQKVEIGPKPLSQGRVDDTGIRDTGAGGTQLLLVRPAAGTGSGEMEGVR